MADAKEYGEKVMKALGSALVSALDIKMLEAAAADDKKGMISLQT